MIAIAQAGSSHYYLNWIPSESGPLVTKYGCIVKINNDKYVNDQYYFDIFESICLEVGDNNSTYSFSLDNQNVLFSSCFADNLQDDLIEWHFNQNLDKSILDLFDCYHYKMSSDSNRTLNIIIAKSLRQSFQANIRLLKSKLNNISVGIFSAEIGARKWMNAHVYSSYIIWKIGKRKTDELLFIKNSELVSYFSIYRKLHCEKILWQ